MKKFFLIILAVILLNFASALTDFTGSQGTATFYNRPFQQYYSSEQIRTYWPILTDAESCTAREDVLLQVALFGCQPTVVRSDILAEQNVPVFCQLNAFRLNPLINIKELQSIDFSGSYPKEVSSVGFHPARAAISSRDQLSGSPFMENIGYVVVVLKKNPKENELPDFLNFTLKGKVSYKAGNALGIGRYEFLLTPTSDESWKVERNRQSFFNGQYFIRLEEVDANRATVSIYVGDKRVSSATVEKGKSSGDIYLPGSYCQAALKATYDSYIAADKIVRLQVDDDSFELYEGSTFLNGKCRVEKIGSEAAGNQSVQLYCGSSRFTLSLAPSLLVGDSVRVLKTNQKGIIAEIKTNGDYAINLEDKTQQTVKFNEIEYAGVLKNAENKQLIQEVKDYYDNALTAFNRVAEDYPKETDIDLSYGERSYDEMMWLAYRLEQYASVQEIFNKFKESYPQSALVKTWSDRLLTLQSLDTSGAGRLISVDNKVRSIRLLEVRQPQKKASASFIVGNDPRSLRVEIGSNLTFVDANNKASYITLDRVTGDSATVTEYCTNNNDRIVKGGSLTLKIGDDVARVCGAGIKLNDLDVQEYAKIRLEPTVKTTGVANFTVGVGIEKRAIKLAPNKTQEKIDDLNKTIQKWTSISNNLGNTVKGLKAACFATTGVLTVKSFLTGLDGTSLARQQVMRGENGWTRRCTDLVAAGTYGSLTQCYNANSGNISRDVDSYSTAIKNTNSKIADIEKDFKTSTGSNLGLGGSTLDQSGAAKKLTQELKQKYGDKIAGKDSQGRDLTVNEVVRDDAYEKGDVSYTQLRDMYTNLDIKYDQQVSSVTRENANDRLNLISNDVYARKQTTQLSSELGTSLSTTGLGGVQVPSYGTQYSTVGEYYGKKLNAADFGLGLDKPAQVITYNQKPYLLVLDSTSQDLYVTQQVYSLQKSGSSYTQATQITSTQEGQEIMNRFSAFRKVDATSYNNKFDKPQVQYYETEPFKGLPALVPFDTDRGWYVATKQNLGGLGDIKAFESSGNPASFWVCNVGPNKRADFLNGIGDDICRQFIYDTGQPVDLFPGLSQEETKNLVSKAREALRSAADQRAQGKKTKILINGFGVDVGTPAANVPGTQCQDFMSPEDCQILFNVCDPVICPSSRCDLGGLYPVSDVIQTGVVGSALLCLPNIQDGVVIPVCLTGIKAGIDSYLSILKSQQQCLQENLQTGRTVGICDAITSVYTCEFFWRQAAPVANVILPKLVELAYGNQQTRGGGEYLTVQNAWDNAQASANYFTQTYAVNSLDAFKIRSVEEAGSTFCRAFVSAKGPKAFESLIEPDSPYQFHAWFSSIPFTDATVPATAQYKVFYHVFAGNDQGVYYNVYLKDPPASSYYSSTATVQVASGYAPRGQFATETKDFTAPEGYKQLCVRVNGKEECGFKQVSTDFAVNYVRDEIVKDEIARTDVTSEAECISGGTNPGALLNLNPQEGLQEALDPAVYNRGIIRICSTLNPGQGTDPTRFVNVGYCDDQKVGCWLDKNSISNAITANNLGTQNRTLSQVTEIQRNALEEQGITLSSTELDDLSENVASITDKKYDADRTKQVVSQLDEALSRAILNSERAKLFIWKGRVYSNSALGLRNSQVTVISPPKISEQTSTVNASVIVASSKPALTLSTGSKSAVIINGQESNIYIDLQKDNALYAKTSTGDKIVGSVRKIDVKQGEIEIGKYDVIVLDKARFIAATNNQSLFDLINGTYVHNNLLCYSAPQLNPGQAACPPY